MSDTLHSYLLILHEQPGAFADTTPAEMAEIVEQYKSWAGGLAQRGLLAGGEKLADEGGRHLRMASGKALATDGPYAEAHDIIGGYFIIKAADMAAAETLARSCPHLSGQRWIEIRRIEVV